MGRAKLAMEYIKKEKARNLTFEKRKKGLKKKAYELATLCDVPVAVVIYPGGGGSEADVFPASEEEVRGIIGRYAGEVGNGKRKINLQDVVEGRKKRKKTKGDNGGGETSDNVCQRWVDGHGRDELERLAAVLEWKLAAVVDRIGALKGMSFGNCYFGGGGEEWPVMCAAPPMEQQIMGCGGGGGGGWAGYEGECMMQAGNEFGYYNGHGGDRCSGSVVGGGGFDGGGGGGGGCDVGCQPMYGGGGGGFDYTYMT